MAPVSAFSLVELLLVLGIISLLVAMLLPSLHSMRAKAKGMSCMNNLRQIHVALRMHADENEEKLPVIEAMPSTPAIPDAPLKSMSEALASYVNHSTQVFRCPQDQNGRFLHEGTSYEWNSTVNNKGMDGVQFGLITLPPTMVILCWDFDNVHTGSGGSSKKNYLFADGHIANEQAASLLGTSKTLATSSRQWCLILKLTHSNLTKGRFL